MTDDRSTNFRLATSERDISDIQLYVRGVPERVTALEESQRDLKGTLNKLVLSIVGFTFTVAISAIGVIATLSA